MPTLPELGVILAMVLVVFAAGRMRALGDALGSFVSHLFAKRGAVAPLKNDGKPR